MKRTATTILCLAVMAVTLCGCYSSEVALYRAQLQAIADESGAAVESNLNDLAEQVVAKEIERSNAAMNAALNRELNAQAVNGSVSTEAAIQIFNGYLAGKARDAQKILDLRDEFADLLGDHQVSRAASNAVADAYAHEDRTRLEWLKGAAGQLGGSGLVGAFGGSRGLDPSTIDTIEQGLLGLSKE